MLKTKENIYKIYNEVILEIRWIL